MRENDGINNCGREREKRERREKMRYGEENGEQRKKEKNTERKGKRNIYVYNFKVHRFLSI